MEIKTIAEYIDYYSNNCSNPKALNDQDKAGDWKGISAQEVVRQIKGIAGGLKNMGLKQGARVGIIGPPSAEWTIANLGIMGGGFISVPIYPNVSEENFRFEITQAEIEVIFVAKPLAHQLANKCKEQFRHIISLDSPPFFKNELSFKDLTSQQHPEPITQAAPDDLGSILYTSGSTGSPKGVELTHRNLTYFIPESLEKIGWTNKDKITLFLPPSHIFGFLANLTMLYADGSIYYMSDIHQLIPTCKEVQPTTILFVPRLLEKMVQTIEQRIKSSSPFKRVLQQWAFDRAFKEKLSWWDRLSHPLAHLVLYSKIQELFGGKLRATFTGSAKADPRHLHFFNAVGIPLSEGYGLTEACPTCMNSWSHYRLGTVGQPLKDISLKLSDEGELLIKGPQVMHGYHKSPELTQQAIDKEGWLHTGDVFSVDNEGYYTFLGRRTELCKTSYGEFVDLTKLESALRSLPLVDYAIALAENRPFVTALLFPDLASIDKIKEQMGMSGLSVKEVLQLDFVKKELDRALEKINARLNKGERIKSYRFVTNAATIEGGELSPSYKMRRKFTHDKYKSLIEELYPVNLMAFDL